MSTYLGKHYHPPGTAPGTLLEHEQGAIEIRLVDYDHESVTERVLESAEQCLEFLQRDSRTWVQVNGMPDPVTLNRFGQLFGLHELALEDVLNTGQRPKMEVYGEQLFIVLTLPVYDSGSVRTAQVSIFAGKDYLVCFSAGEQDPFEPLRKRMRPPNNGRISGAGIDYLLYAIVDFVIDAAFPVLESIGDEIELLEEALLEDPRPAYVEQIHRLRRELLLIRRRLWPQREVVSQLLRSDNPLIAPPTLVFLRDCHDHAVQIIDLLESFREMTASLLDVYLSSIGNRTNEVMRVLTIIATIFIPLTFIVGVYGMNFDPGAGPWSMPELRWHYGYPIVWLIMIGIAVALLWLFRRRKWI